MFGGDSEEVTPVPIPNTAVKLFSADGSWGFPPVRVGRRQAISKISHPAGLFLCITFIMKRNQITVRQCKAVFYYVVKKATLYAKTAIFFHDLMKAYYRNNKNSLKKITYYFYIP
jgi:hypothetical protein